jgi:7-cyano-7-deazaguanine synthase in queuosine biosynthesis
MKVLIPWSGGLDSTYLVFKALSEGHEVTTCSFILTNNKGQVEMEKLARKNIKKLIDKTFPKANISYIESIEINIDRYVGEIILGQPVLWIMSSMFNLTNDIDEIWMGYVMNDDAVSYTKEILNLYEACKPFSAITKFPVIKFPIIKHKKYDLMDEYKGMKDLISFCETPDFMTYKEANIYLPCGHCESCLKHQKQTGNEIKSIRERTIIDYMSQCDNNVIERKVKFKYTEEFKDELKEMVDNDIQDQMDEIVSKVEEVGNEITKEDIENEIEDSRAKNILIDMIENTKDEEFKQEYSSEFVGDKEDAYDPDDIKHYTIENKRTIEDYYNETINGKKEKIYIIDETKLVENYFEIGEYVCFASAMEETCEIKKSPIDKTTRCNLCHANNTKKCNLINCRGSERKDANYVYLEKVKQNNNVSDNDKSCSVDKIIIKYPSGTNFVSRNELIIDDFLTENEIIEAIHKRLNYLSGIVAKENHIAFPNNVIVSHNIFNYFKKLGILNEDNKRITIFDKYAVSENRLESVDETDCIILHSL